MVQAARTVALVDGLDVHRVGDDTIVRNGTDVVSLDSAATRVFDAIDGRRSDAEIADRTGLPFDQVIGVLDRLRSEGVVDHNWSPDEVSRRRILLKTAVAGATGVALPVIHSVMMPTIAAAQSGDPGGGPATPGVSTVDFFNGFDGKYWVDVILFLDWPGPENYIGRYHIADGSDTPLDPSNYASVGGIGSSIVWRTPGGDGTWATGTTVGYNQLNSNVTVTATTITIVGNMLTGLYPSTGTLNYNGTLSGTPQPVPTAPNPYVPPSSPRSMTPNLGTVAV